MRLRFLGLLAPVLLLGACDSSTDEQDKSASTPPAAIAATQIDGDYLTTGGDGTNWAATGFNYYEQRFSPLGQINRGNVGQLGVAWSADLPAGEVPQSTPIVADGKIYITTPRSRVFAFDGATGKQLWTFDAGLAQPTVAQAASGVGNQGLAIWKGRLYLATLDGQLIALDAITGAQLWSIQTGGEPGAYRITSTPRVVKNMIIIGSGRAVGGGRGYVSAYDANDGALRWRFYTVPRPDGEAEKASSDAVLRTAQQTWGGAALGAAAGGYVTDAVSYDPDLDQLYIGVGAGPATGVDGGDRLFLSSIVALDPDDGEYLWHYQETPGSRPAFGASQPFVLADLPIPPPAPVASATPPVTQPTPNATPDVAPCPAIAPPPGPDGDPMRRQSAECQNRAKGAVPERKVLMQASDNGFFLVIDRTSGKLLSAVNLFGGTPFDRAAWTIGYDPETGRPVPARASAATAQSGKTKGSGKPAAKAPAATPRPVFPPVDALRPPRWMSFNPATGLVYFTLPHYAGQAPPADGAADTLPDTPLPPPAWRIDGARIVAFDPVAGEIRWSRELTAPRNGNPLSTSGGLLFLGTGIGRFVALDAATGETVYNRDLGSGMAGAPSSFLVDGQQYVAVLTGLGGRYDWPAAEGSTEAKADGKKGGASDRNAPRPRILTVPATTRLVLLTMGGSKRIPTVPLPRPSPTPMPSPAATPTPEPRRP